MSTDISVHSSSYQVEDRSWLVGTHGVDVTPGITLDISKFTVVNGYIKSGQHLGKITASGLYGPYDGALSNGQEVCAGLLFSSVRAVDSNGTALTKVGGARFIHGLVNTTKLPATVDTAGQADLPLIVWL